MSKALIFTVLVGGLAFFTTSYLRNVPSPIVTIDDGKLQGRIGYSRDGNEYFEYLSIPFAEPPVGTLRFEAPVPLKKPWTGIKEASSYPPFCLQFDALVRAKVFGQEDCLYLNVFSKANDGKKPVMIFFHGGGFMTGSTKMYQPQFFMDEDIVLVTMNYRLGPLGFMNLEDGFIRGNMGLKDQLLALKWVQKNIHHFGGDPTKVTIFGESAGAASVEYHMISPLSKGLFHRAILQSGSVTGPWAFNHSPKETAIGYVKNTECSGEKGDKLVECLKRIDPAELVKQAISTMDPRNPLVIFSPTVETVVKSDTFLSENPRNILKAGKIVSSIPAIFGFTSSEGALRTAIYDSVPEAIPELDKNWVKLAGRSLYFHDDDIPAASATKLRNKYFGSSSFTENIQEFKKNFTVMASDGIFYGPIQRAARYHAKQGAPVYMYYYDYELSILPGIYSLLRAVRSDDWILADLKLAYAVIGDLAKKWLNMEGPHEFVKSCHADDLFMLFNMEGWTGIFTGPDTKFSKALIKSLVDFAKNKESLEFDGVPWPRFTPGTPSSPPQYMLIGKQPKAIPEPFAERASYWKTLKIRE